jgi:D-beta-D-heptose 7-phosphate kinase/D-beta-D-heptose 1-phosphate adenosyltransferase
MLDHYVFGDVERISPEAPIPILRVDREEWRPGGAGSVVCMLERLGAEVALVAATGDDAWSIKLAEALAELDVKTDGLVADPSRPTTLKTRHIAGTQHVLRVDREVAAAHGEAIDRALIEAVQRRLDWADVVIVSDYGKGVLKGGVLDALREAVKAGKQVILDPKKQPDYSAYRGMTAITPNRKETEAGTGIAPSDAASFAAAAERLLETLSLERVVMTLDKEGIYLGCAGGQHLHVPTESRAVYDVTGAGDMVIGTIGLARAQGWSWEDAVHLANAAAGLEITRVGVAALTREEIANALLGRTGGTDEKVTTIDRFAAEVLPELRRKGRRLVFTNGCFDILHVGHVQLLQFAREQGDHLIVGLNSDASVRRLKGPGRPILEEDARASLLAALQCVGHVIVFDEDTPLSHIEKILPDVLVKAADYENKAVVGRSVVEAAGGEVVLGALAGGVSTTQILARARAAEGHEEAQDAARAAAEAAYRAVEATASRGVKGQVK